MKRSLAILGVVLLAGCARFQPQPLSPAKTAAELDSRSLTNAALKIFLEKNLNRELAGWPTHSWDFHMLTLAAFYYHPSLEVARNEWRLAQAGTKTAAGRPNPTVTVTPGFDPSIPGNPIPWIVPVTLDLPIETAGKRGRRIQTARHLSESAQLSIATAAWQVRSALRSSLLDLASAQQREALLVKQRSTQEQIMKLLEQQAEVGAIAAPELAPARVALAKANADLADSRRQLAEARPRVADAIGVPVAALNAVTLDFDLKQIPAPDHLTSADARRTALLSRTDILAALADYAASQSALQLEIARQYPDMHLSPGYIFNAGSAGDSQWELGLTVELPVLNRNQGPIAEAEARRAIAASRFIALQAKIIGEIDRVVAVYDANRINMAALRQVALAQKAQSEIVEAQFKARELEQLDIRRAEFELVAAQLAELDAQIKLQQAAGALEDAVQRPLDETAAIPMAAVLGADRQHLPSSSAK
jgi:outer membrane protein TolC